eukprot:5368198-Prymnesium_polylepis.2
MPFSASSRCKGRLQQRSRIGKSSPDESARTHTRVCTCGAGTTQMLALHNAVNCTDLEPSVERKILTDKINASQPLGHAAREAACKRIADAEKAADGH